MAGSYLHVVNDDGILRSPYEVLDMLDTHSGDVYEAIEELYGMIWYMAAGLAAVPLLHGGEAPDRSSVVEIARQNYKEGLRMSPTPRFKE